MINSDLLSIGNPFWLGMTNHLWQSTLFGAAAWLIILFLKKNRARLRYWIWFSVSIKFLIPFSLIVSLGSMIAPEWSETPVEIPPEWNVIQTINQPFSHPELKAVSPALDTIETSSQPEKAPWTILSLWLCGSLAILSNWHKQRVRVSGMVRKAELLKDGHTAKEFHRIKLENRISHTVQMVSTRDTMEPGVFGIFRPVILLPAGILSHINDSELETILLHEFEHIQSKDNLIAFIHMLVEALFWFHPIVWWTGYRLVVERELACDESVLQSGRNPRAYAEGILKICENYFMSPQACVSGIVGSNLKKRIEGILKKQIGHKLSFTKILFLSLAGLLVLCIPLTTGMINKPSSQAQASVGDSIEPEADGHKSDVFEASVEPGIDVESSEVINTETDKNTSSSVNSDALLQEDQNRKLDMVPGSAITPEPPPDDIEANFDEMSTIEKKIPAIGAHPEIQGGTKAENGAHSFETVQTPVLSTDVEDSILSAQKEAPVNASTGAGNSGIEPKTGEADTDQNQDISDFGKPDTIPEKYNLDNDLTAVDRITLFDIRSFENIDKQSLIIRTSYSDYYLLVLRRPRFEVSFGQTNFDFSGSTIIAGHDRVVMSYPSTQYYVIEKIYKLKGRKQVTEIKKRLGEK